MTIQSSVCMPIRQTASYPGTCRLGCKIKAIKVHFCKSLKTRYLLCIQWCCHTVLAGSRLLLYHQNKTWKGSGCHLFSEKFNNTCMQPWKDIALQWRKAVVTWRCHSHNWRWMQAGKDKRLQVIPLLLISERVHTPPFFSGERLCLDFLSSTKHYVPT